MYVVKYVQGSAARRDVGALAPPRHLVSLNADQIAGDVLAGLAPVLIHRASLRSVIASIVKRWIATEVRFVADVLDEKAAARFCERQREHADEFTRLVVEMLSQILNALPEHSCERGRLAWNVSLVNLITDVPVLVQRIVDALVARNYDSGHLMLGAASARVVVTNLLRTSKLTDEQARQRPKSVIWPKDSVQSSVELVASFLAGTPLAVLLMHEVTVNSAKRLVG